MSKWENPSSSFSSSLLDKIYRSIDESEHSNAKSTMPKRNNKGGKDATIEKETAASRRACLIDKWMEKKAKEKAEAERGSRKLGRDHDDGVLFSSNSCSSESSSGGLSSSDTESMYGAEPHRKASCFAPSLWPKPIRTTRPQRKTEEKKTEKKKQSALFPQQREHYVLDDYTHVEKIEDSTNKSRSRALKLYDNLKKAKKQPLSAGGRVSGFLNTLFTSGQVKKAKASTSSLSGYEEKDRKIYSLKETTCSSASSFSRSCLNQHPPITRDQWRNGVKKTVRFNPESVADRNDYQAHVMPVETVELRQAKNESLLSSREFSDHGITDIDDDDGASCASSDLFELDLIAVAAGKDRYQEELPVYETTRVNRSNRAIDF